MAHRLNLRLPLSLREEARKAAEAEGVSLNQYCALAIARAVGESQSRRFFAARSGGLSRDEARDKMAALLDRVKE